MGSDASTKHLDVMALREAKRCAEQALALIEVAQDYTVAPVLSGRLCDVTAEYLDLAAIACRRAGTHAVRSAADEAGRL